jgi:hypothetical protein
MQLQVSGGGALLEFASPLAQHRALLLRSKLGSKLGPKLCSSALALLEFASPLALHRALLLCSKLGSKLGTELCSSVRASWHARLEYEDTALLVKQYVVCGDI